MLTCRHVFLISNRTISTQAGGTLKVSRYEGFEEPMKLLSSTIFQINYMHEMDIEWFCSNEWKREREGWEGIEHLQEGSKGLSYTDEWALAGNQ